MANLLGTWELGRGYGHIAHLAPLAQAMKDRGHRVSVAPLHPATAEAAPGQPFDRILTPPIYRPPNRPRTPTLTYAQVVADGGFADPPAAIELVRAWLTLFDAVGPEAILAEHAPMSMLAAHVARLPAAMIGTGFTVPPASRPLPSLLPAPAATEADRASADAAADAVVRDVCRAFGAPRLDGIAALIATAHPCLTTWPELDGHGPRAGATYYGPIGGFGGRARPAWPQQGGPRIFVYLPFGRPRSRDLVDALSALAWPTIWHAALPPADGLPGNIRYTAEPADLPRLLADATLLVTRGAHGTACQSLAAGRPQLLLPDTLEAALTAHRLAAQRLGVVPPDAGPAGLQTALARLAGDGAIAAAAVATKARYAGYRPELAAAQLADAIIGEFVL